MSKGSRCGDVLIVPMGLAGHVNPLMYLAKQLMERGISVTVVISVDEKELLAGYIQDGGGKDGLLNVEVVMSTRALKGGDPGILGLCTNFGRACEPYLDGVLAEQEATGQGPKCMIADQFLGWTQEILCNTLEENTSKFLCTWLGRSLHRLYSPSDTSTYPASGCLPVINCLISENGSSGHILNDAAAGDMRRANGLLDHRDENPVIAFPGVPVLHLSDMPRGAKQSPRFITHGGDTLREADGMLLNTFYELESAAIQAFDAQVKATDPPGKVPKILPIGPLLPAEFFSKDTFEVTAKDSECISWLNTRPPSSVIYVAFGTTAFLSPPQIQELACGLEASHVPFLWVLRVKSSQSDSEDVMKLLPPGFQARTKDRGLIYTNFAPQLQILSNPAVGGFLTHCGWNSSLESICKGIPMIGWPMVADQRLCCRILVDQAKVAMEVKVGLEGPGEVVEKDDIQRAVTLLMTHREGSDLKKRALELQVQARAAAAPGGSSQRSFEVIVEDIQGRKTATRQAQR